MMVPQLDGCAVLTVEGLAGRDGTLHPVQQALIDTDATQCGFCTPGFAMAMLAFHHGGEPATDDPIHEALAGNLCRCTGYRAIVDACRRIASGPADRFAGDAPATAAALRELPAATDYRHGAQAYLAPRSLDELLAARAQHPDAILLAGGTDLGLRVSKDREAFPLVISTAQVAELRRITSGADALELGGAVTYTQALPASRPALPVVRRADAPHRLAPDPQSRHHRGQSRHRLADRRHAALPDDARCLGDASLAKWRAHHAGGGFHHRLPARRARARRSDRVDPHSIRAGGPAFAAYKLSKRFDQDISAVVARVPRSTLQGGKVRELRAAYGGMAARAMRAPKVEAALAGRPWQPAWTGDIDTLLARDFTPIGDHRGGAAYRLRAAGGLLRRFLRETTSTAPMRVEAL